MHGVRRKLKINIAWEGEAKEREKSQKCRVEHISKKTCFLCGRDSSDLTFGGGKEDTYATPKTSKYKIRRNP